MLRTEPDTCQVTIKYYLLLYVGESNGTPLQSSCLENCRDGGARWAAVHGVAKSRTRLSDFTFTFHFHALEKEMATHSRVFAWRIPGTGEPSGLPSMGSHRVGHDWSDLAAAAAAVICVIKSENCGLDKMLQVNEVLCFLSVFFIFFVFLDFLFWNSISFIE